MTTNETMTVDEALAELRAVGADAKLWTKGYGTPSIATIYVNSDAHDIMDRPRVLAQVNVDRHTMTVSCTAVWIAIHRYLTK